MRIIAPQYQMNDSKPYLTIEELIARLRLDRDAARELLSEMVASLTKEYLTLEEVAQRLSWDEKTVRNKMAAGIFKRGLHYFSPPGIRPRFKWSAIVAWLEGEERAASEKPTDAIPMARGYRLGGRSTKKAS